LIERAGAKEEDVLIVGHSLGTGVAAKLAVDLAEKGVRPRGVVFMSPFSSIRTVLDTYSILGFFPLMKPLAMIPGAPREFLYSSSSRRLMRCINRAGCAITHTQIRHIECHSGLLSLFFLSSSWTSR
jgi:acetyl esterase/lipase